MAELFRGKDNVEAYYADDNNPEWWEPSKNPFLHGCCNCGLMHKIEYRIEEGKLQLRFTIDHEETKRLRHYLSNQGQSESL